MKRKFATNKLFNLFIIIGAFLIITGSIWIIGDEEQAPMIAEGVTSIVFGAIMIIAPSILMPCVYAFDEEGVSLCYLFLPKERYLWKNIRAIEATDDARGNSKSAIFDLLFSQVFEINGNVEGPLRFYMSGKIRRSLRTKYLLEKYYDGKISGYLFEGLKERMQESRAKKQGKALDTAQIAADEREARKNAKEWLEPYLPDFRQLDLNVEARFIYVTKDAKEHNSRPKKPYTYSVVVKISAKGQGNDPKFTEISADLISGRLGKKAFVGVPYKTAREELTFYLESTLEELRKSITDTLCEG